MSVSPLRAGETHVILSVTWTADDGTAISLTGATITMRISAGGGASTLGAGAIVITNAPGGLFTYAPTAGDFATANTYALQFKAVYGDATVLYSDLIPLTVLAPI